MTCKPNPNFPSFLIHLPYSTLSRNSNSQFQQQEGLRIIPNYSFNTTLATWNFSYIQIFISIDLRQVPYTRQLRMNVFFLLILQFQFN